MASQSFDLTSNLSHIWIFGYGSLIWRPNFSYTERIVGYVNGFERRFWQGSIYDRGSTDRPGRVATLVEKEGSDVWGVCYKVQGTQNIKAALRHLRIREQHYEARFLEFHPQNATHESQAIMSLVFYASPGNDNYLGAASCMEIATDIFFSCGVTGHNIEYLLRVADFMREEVVRCSTTTTTDEHLFSIEKFLRLKLGLCTKNIISWLELMKNTNFIDSLTSMSINARKKSSENFITV
eukprot:gene20607-22640_t